MNTISNNSSMSDITNDQYVGFSSANTQPFGSVEDGASVFLFQSTSHGLMMTPTPSNHAKHQHITDEICSVCLSPFAIPCNTLKTIDFDEDADTGIEDMPETQLRVVTKCHHVFHAKCLNQVKSRKAECPNCRCVLTPILPIVTPDSSPQAIRQTIVSNANRVRQNMELAARRRQLNFEPQQE